MLIMQIAKKARGASGSLSDSMSAMDLDEGDLSSLPCNLLRVAHFCLLLS